MRDPDDDGDNDPDETDPDDDNDGIPDEKDAPEDEIYYGVCEPVRTGIP